MIDESKAKQRQCKHLCSDGAHHNKSPQRYVQKFRTLLTSYEHFFCSQYSYTQPIISVGHTISFGRHLGELIIYLASSQFTSLCGGKCEAEIARDFFFPYIGTYLNTCLGELFCCNSFLCVYLCFVYKANKYFIIVSKHIKYVVHFAHSLMTVFYWVAEHFKLILSTEILFVVAMHYSQNKS